MKESDGGSESVGEDLGNTPSNPWQKLYMLPGDCHRPQRCEGRRSGRESAASRPRVYTQKYTTTRTNISYIYIHT